MALALSLSASAFAQNDARDTAREGLADTLAKASQANALTIPLNPPIGTPFEYTVIIEKKRPKGDSRMELDQRLTFTRMGEGYTLDLDILAVSTGGGRLDLTDPEALAAMPISARPFITSLDVELDASGEMVRVKDWPALSAMLSALPDEVARRVQPERRENAAAMAKELLAPMLTASAEDAAYILVKGWPSILGYGGTQLDAGAAYEAESQIGGDNAILPEPIPALVEFQLSRTDQGDYLFEQSTTPDAEAMTVAMEAFITRVQAMSEAKPDNDFEITDISFVDALRVVFDQTSGLPTTATLTRTTVVNGATVGGEVITITKAER